MSFGNPFATSNLSDSGVQGLGHSGFEVSLNYVAALPDPNIIANPTIKLWFKSLLKRDETTKEKALVELVQFATAANATELKDDLVLITWVQLYPKLSISDSKVVRSLAHQLQTQLISTLQRSYVKYLKDTIPVLLSGIYDLDTSVVNSTIKNISKAFNDDQKKVNNLWIIFQNEILNFADQVLNKETVDSLSDDRFVPRDEAELRYLRLVNATVSMVSHLIQVGYKLSPEKLDKNIEAYHAFFTYENLWHYLLVNTNVNNQRIYKTLLQLINAVVHLQPELFTEKAWKLMSKRLFKSLTFVKKVDPNSTNAVVYSSLVLPIISTLNNLNTKNPSFFQYDKSHKERIVDFFKIGSLNSDASYYSKLSQFIISASSVFTAEDSPVLEKILHKDFKFEVLKNSKFRAGAPFIIQSLVAYLEVLTHSGSIETCSPIIDDVVGFQAPVSSQLVEPLVKFVPKWIITKKLNEWCVKDSGNIAVLLSASTGASTSLDTVLSTSFDDLRDRAEEDEEGTTFSNHHAFTIYDYVIKENLTDYTFQVEEFLDELPSFITPLIIKQPIEILKDYSKSTLYNKDTFVDIFDSFVVKLDLLGSKKLILSKLDSFGHREDLLDASEELQTTINEQTSNYDFETDELFKQHLITKESVISLWDLALTKGKETEYVVFLLKNNKHDDELCRYVLSQTSVLDALLWKSPLIPELHEKVTSLLIDSDSIRDHYIAMLKNTVIETGATPEVIEQVSKALSHYPALSSELTSEDFIANFITAYGSTIDSRLSIGNPLETNIYLLALKDGSFHFETLLGVIRYAVFIHDLSLDVSHDLSFYFSILSEVADDYEFLNDGTHSTLPELSAFQSTVKFRLLENYCKPYTALLSEIIDKSFHTLAPFVPGNDDVLSFYQCRVLKVILNNASSSESTSKLLEVDLDKYTRDAVRSKSSSDLLMFCTVVSSLQSVLSDPKFDRVKNLIGSELIGIRPSEILTVGLKKLTVLTNFVGDLTPGEMPLQTQRFNMIVKELSKWLDSEVAYEPEFGLVRIQMLHLLQLWNNNTYDKTDSFKELTSRVLQDATGLVNLEEGENHLELKYWAMKLYLTLRKYGDVLEKDVVTDIDSELLESYIQDGAESVNQPVIIYNELLTRFLEKVPRKNFQEHQEALFEKYAFMTNFALKRPLLNILRQLIINNQQDLVVEFELSKDGDDMDQFKIPQRLIDGITKAPQFHGLASIEEDERLVEYLWSWTLVLLCFKDITLKLRTMYIQQLQNENNELITRFLNFIALIVTDEEDKSFMSRLDENHATFIDYNYENDVEDVSEEVKLLSMHIYYSILVSIGSLASNWFNNIKDRGFKANLERSTAKFISPRLIQNKLSSFEKHIARLTKENENLTIKINRITNEIKATYLIDEQHLEVAFKIPQNYPLSNVEVTGPQRVGVKEQQWKAWLLSCQRIVSLQNGEISESLEFFLKNVSFHFKGFEECAICYSILHQDNSLPSKVCGTCRNKFHAGCLYKWFKSSGSNTCPLCRSSFNFGAR